MIAVMTNLVDQLRLAERAKEDIYFAKLDRDLIEALHQKALLNQLRCERPSDDNTPSHAAVEADNSVAPEEIPKH